MSEDQEREENLPARVTRAYRRAGAGLAAAALLWTAALLFSGENEIANWLIPIVAAALSVLCFSLYRKSNQYRDR